jgi:hypothetical protein
MNVDAGVFDEDIVDAGRGDFYTVLLRRSRLAKSHHDRAFYFLPCIIQDVRVCPSMAILILPCSVRFGGPLGHTLQSLRVWHTRPPHNQSSGIGS